MQGYIPVSVYETDVDQRRADQRIIAAAGYPLPRRTPVRQRIGAILVSLGAALAGQPHVLAPEPELTLQSP